MDEISKRIIQLEKEIAALPSGYISVKNIRGKERRYLQWLEQGKLKSKYIKADELEAVTAQVEKRKRLQEELKVLKETPAGKQNINLKRKAARNMLQISGKLMLEDREIATVKNGEIISCDEQRLPLYLKRTKDMERWLASRAIDEHRTNSRLLKKALRIRTTDDVQTVLAVNGATVTDRYWFKPDGSGASYDDILFKENYFDSLALRGDPNGFSHKPSRTPELTNTGSFEKCWRLIDNEWWMYKSGNQNEYFSELFICRLGEKLGLPMAHYEMDGEYIRTKNFTGGKAINFEPMAALTEDDDYKNCFDILYGISAELAEQYLQIIWLDTVCYNMDRHTENFGFLRNVEDGEIVSLAPNYDNNIALISRGYPNTAGRENDGFIRFFRDFLQESRTAAEMYRSMDLPVITEELIDDCMDEIPFQVNRDFIKAFILNGQKIINDIIVSENLSETEEPTLSM
ncbi:HipA domain-containing protein [Hydrogeniiclostridium mannosilyticum]|uniref:HipA domain-containing protein n=1 Tax=Hydrogeniiclostridium mannosilyticum TaxID=2764322 RepID=UPI003999A7C2